MKNYKITINGNVYNATVEPASPHGAVVSAPAPMPAAPVVAAPAPTSSPVPTPTPPATSSTAGSGTKVESPMPGTIIKYLVNTGDTVSLHQVVAILEAMKMENEIVAPVAGKITSIVITAGSPVNAGDVLLTIE